MPLKKGSSDATVGANIKEMMHDVKHGDGKIGNYRPPTVKKAQKVAVAVAMKKAGRSRNKKT